MSTEMTLNQARGAGQSSEVTMGFGNQASFELMQRAAKLLCNSTLVPAAYRAVTEKRIKDGSVINENPNALPNAVVALNMAQRMGADPLMVMQNLYIIEGRPSWSSQWIIAAINGCGRFSPLRFEIKNLGKKKVEYVNHYWENRQKQREVKTIEIDNIVCIAWAIEKETGERIESPQVSIELAVKEGWYTKDGSKWQTMPDVMLRYRSASFFGKLYAPELLMGLATVEEAQDMVIDATTAADGSIYVDTDALKPAQNEPEESPKPKAKHEPKQAAKSELKTDPENGEPEQTSTPTRRKAEVE